MQVLIIILSIYIMESIFLNDLLESKIVKRKEVISLYTKDFTTRTLLRLVDEINEGIREFAKEGNTNCILKLDMTYIKEDIFILDTLVAIYKKEFKEINYKMTGKCCEFCIEF